MNVRFAHAKADEILPALDRWATLIRQVQACSDGKLSDGDDRIA